MKITFSKLLVALILSSTSQFSKADSFVDFGLHFGGDTLASAFFVGGGSEDVKAGELFSLNFGQYVEVQKDVRLKMSLGYKFDTVEASNGSLDFQRLTADFIALTKNEQWEYGAGLAYHMRPVLSGFGITTVDFDNALGYVLEVNYIDDNIYYGIRLTGIEYQPITPGFGGTVNGDSIGFVIGFLL